MKKGSVYLFSYEDVEDLCVEKVGWFMNATCQLITHRFPHQPLKAKDADEAPNAFSIVRNQISTWEAARSLMLEIRDSRRCPHCGGFVSLQDADSDAAAQPSLVEPLTFGESETLTRALQPEEQVLCQIHAARFAKALVATDRRVLVVMGGKASSIPYSNVSDVVVTDSYVRLVLTERPDRGELKPLEVVKSDDAVPCGPEDRAKFEIAADLIRQRAGGRAPAV